MEKTAVKNEKTLGRQSLGAPAFSGRRKRKRSVSEYKKSLQEKQDLKKLYGLGERQFKRYVKESLAKMGKVQNISDELVGRLEQRLDNVVFRLGIAQTRRQARQMVSHAYFLVQGKPVNVPSYQFKKGNVIAIKETKKKKIVFKDLQETLKKTKPPSWLKLDLQTLSAEAVGVPNISEANPPVEISLIFEFYSR